MPTKKKKKATVTKKTATKKTATKKTTTKKTTTRKKATTSKETVAKKRSPRKKSPLTAGRDLELGFEKVLALSARPGHAEVAVGGRSGRVVSVTIEDGEVLREFKGHDAFVTALAYSPDGERLASTGNDKTLRIWSAETGEFEQDLAGIFVDPRSRTLMGQFMRSSRPGHTLTPRSLDWIEGDIIGSGGQDRKVKFWQEGRMLRTFDWHAGPISVVAFRPGTQELLSASHDQTLRTWNHETGSMVHKYTGHEGGVEAAAWLGADRLVSGDLVGQILIWDAETEHVISRAPLVESPVRVLAADLENERLYAGFESGALCVYDLEGALVQSIEAHSDALRSLVLSSDGESLISGGNDGRVRVWQIN